MHDPFIRSIRFIVVAAVLAAATVTSAAPTFGQSRTFSLRAGVSATTLSGERAFDPLANLSAAMALRQTFGSYFAQAEAVVSSRGGSLPLEEPYPIVPGTSRPYSSVRTTVTYVDIPLLLGVRFGSPYRPFLYAGPYAGMRVDAQHRYTYADTGLSTTRDADDLRRFDYGATAGLGAELPTRFYRMIFDLRAVAGMASAFDDADERHRALTLSAGVIF